MAKRANKIKQKKNPMQTAFTRFMFVIAFFILWIGGISVRLVHLQVNQSGWLAAKAQDQRRDETKTKMLRGTIYDRSERALAMSVKVKSLFADPSEIEDIDTTAKRVADILKVPKQTIFATLKDAKEANKRFVWLARKVDEETAQKLNTYLETANLRKGDLPKYGGLHWKEEQQRTYPLKDSAAQVVGFINGDEIGQAGIEQSQEEILRGAMIKKWQDRDRLGRVYDESSADDEPREPPKDIVLTISSTMQYKVEKALEKGVKASNSKSGMAIALDPKTGEILAMANYPSFDPNNFAATPPEDYQNKTIQSLYAPGSVFKLVTYGSALDKNLISPDAKIDCSAGRIEVADHVFTDSHTIGTVTYIDALAHSSNVGAIKTGLRVGKEDFYGYAQKFGFGQTTGIELPAEARGLFRAPQNWNGDSLASMSIGYEIGVTALQVASAYGAIANDGVRIKPHIVKEIRYAGGKTFQTPEIESIQVVSAEAARNLRKMLRQVVLNGTGRRAQLNGYTAAGKTGTAWKYNAKLKKVDAGKYVSSFVGFAPADNPQVVVLVVMDEPKSGARDGGMVAAPVFKEIAEQILPELNVAPDDRNARPENLQTKEIPTEIADAKNDKKSPDENKISVKKDKIEKDLPKKSDAPKKPVSEEKPKGDTKNKSVVERKKQKT